MEHICKEEFLTEKIDNCSGKGINRCWGTERMTLEVWYCDKDGTETYFDNWALMNVKFCPFCGKKSEKEGD